MVTIDFQSFIFCHSVYIELFTGRIIIIIQKQALGFRVSYNIQVYKQQLFIKKIYIYIFVVEKHFV